MYRIHLRRSAFTLIELLVVIAIIAILASLLMGGVMMFLRKGPEVENRNDLLQLSAALQDFHKKHRFYPPDRIKLHTKLASYNSAVALDQSSLSYLGTIWPNLDRTPATDFLWGGATALPPAGVTLEGDQCLVFFLGGMPNGAGQAPQGFYNNPANPTVAAGTSTDRVKYFDFQSARCIPLRSDPFPSYIDAHNRDNRKGRAFVYFTAGKRPNGYSATNTFFNVAPYIEQLGTPNRYYMPSSYQLISAGTDGEFGPGGAWTPGGGNVATKDDIANFHGGQLGSQ